MLCESPHLCSEVICGAWCVSMLAFKLLTFKAGPWCHFRQWSLLCLECVPELELELELCQDERNLDGSGSHVLLLVFHVFILCYRHDDRQYY